MGSDFEDTQQTINTEHDEDELREMLIIAIKANPIIYDCSSNSARNKYLRENAWKDVALSIDKQECWCKSEWKKLKDNYTKKKKAIIGKTGQARKKIELWTHFLGMQFLDDFLIKSNTSGSLVEPDPVVEIDSQDADGEHDADGESSGATTPSITKQPSDPTYSLKRNRKKDEVDVEIVNYLKRPKETQDEHHHYGMGVAEELRKMAPAMASYVKMKISTLMYESLYPTTPV